MEDEFDRLHAAEGRGLANAMVRDTLELASVRRGDARRIGLSSGRQRAAAMSSLHALELSEAQMRAMVARAMDHIIDALDPEGGSRLPAEETHRDVAASMREPELPERGEPVEGLLAALFELVTPASLNSGVPCSSSALHDETLGERERVGVERLSCGGSYRRRVWQRHRKGSASPVRGISALHDQGVGERAWMATLGRSSCAAIGTDGRIGSTSIQSIDVDVCLSSINARDVIRQPVVTARPGCERNRIKDKICARAEHVGVVDPAHEGPIAVEQVW